VWIGYQILFLFCTGTHFADAFQDRKRDQQAKGSRLKRATVLWYDIYKNSSHFLRRTIMDYQYAVALSFAGENRDFAEGRCPIPAPRRGTSIL